MQFSVVLPVYNQGDSIQRVVEGFASRLGGAGLDFELVLVPNGCRDDSEARCAELAAKDGRVRVVPSPRAGWGAAVRAGLVAARGDFLCYSNSSRTHADDLLLVLEAALRNPRGVTKAWRRNRQSVVRSAGSLLYNLECRLLLGVRSPDVNGTPKVFPRSFDALTRLRSDGDLLDLEFMHVCHRLGAAVEEVPTYNWHRASGRSTTGLKSAFKMYRGALDLWWGGERA